MEHDTGGQGASAFDGAAGVGDRGPAAGRALVIADGSVGGLVAMAIASEETVRRENVGRQSPPVVWPAWVDGAEASALSTAVRRQADAYGLAVISAQALAAGGAGPARKSELLVRAGGIALANGCRRVIWPVQAEGATASEPGPVEAVGLELDRALLAARLVSLDAEGSGLPEVSIETPFVDLSDGQLAELAADLSVPVEACWWWGESGGAGAAERMRWGAVLGVAV